MSSDDDEDFGPTLPPQLANHAAEKVSHRDDDEEDFGPMPPPSAPVPAASATEDKEDTLPTKQPKTAENTAAASFAVTPPPLPPQDFTKRDAVLSTVLPKAQTYERSFAVAESGAARLAAFQVFPHQEGMILGIDTDGVGRWWRKLTMGMMLQEEKKLVDKHECLEYFKRFVNSPVETQRNEEASAFVISETPKLYPKKCVVLSLPDWKVKIINIEIMQVAVSLDIPFPKWSCKLGMCLMDCQKNGANLVVFSKSTPLRFSMTRMEDIQADGKLAPPQKSTVWISPPQFMLQNEKSKIVVSVCENGCIDYFDPTTSSNALEPIVSNKKGGPPLSKMVTFARKFQTSLLELTQKLLMPVQCAMGAEYFVVAAQSHHTTNTPYHLLCFHLVSGKLYSTLVGHFDVDLKGDGGKQSIALGTESLASITVGLYDVLSFAVAGLGIVHYDIHTKRIVPGVSCHRDFSNPAQTIAVNQCQYLQVAIESSQKLRNIISASPLSMSGRSVASYEEGAGKMDPLLLFRSSAAPEKLYIASNRGAMLDRDWHCTKEEMESLADGGGGVSAEYVIPKKTCILLRLHNYAEPIKLRLFVGKAPLTCYNFAKLAESGFYKNLTFHRIIKKFMMQGGCPKGDGTGGKSAFPEGKEFQDENLSAAIDKPFLLCMANHGPNTNSSQFFITTGAAPWLSGKHTVFGEVVEGFTTVRAVDLVAVGEQDRPKEAVVIDNMEVLESE